MAIPRAGTGISDNNTKVSQRIAEPAAKFSR